MFLCPIRVLLTWPSITSVRRESPLSAGDKQLYSSAFTGTLLYVIKTTQRIVKGIFTFLRIGCAKLTTTESLVPLALPLLLTSKT